MSTTAPRRETRQRGSDESAGWFAAWRRLLDRPLTSYQLVLGVSALLLALGLVMVLSASSVLSYKAYGSSYFIFGKQAIWVLIALPCAYVVSRLPVNGVRLFAYPLLFFAIVLIGLTYVPGLGVEVNGNRNWLSFGGPLQVQPSEIAKLALVIWVADLYARKEKLLGDWKHLLIPMLPVTLLVTLMVVGQRDLGTALVMFAVILGMLWVANAPMRLFGGAFLALGGLVAFLAAADEGRVRRLSGFMDPFSDYSDGGWQAAHGLMGLASGQFWGVGLGASRQKWGTLPEAHTDFIFAVIGEELGLAGTLVVLALFVVLAYAGLRIAQRSRDPFVRFAAAGITVWLLSQTVINIGMVLGFLPVIGIPLPLISYGGSALLPTVIALGLLVSFARTEPGAQAALKAQKDRRVRMRRMGRERAVRRGK
ncbi:putative lipid II flippase FtsW [Solicola gregarius]|uniref:Probable peptidoglycan glycosyltransferase FtsW n=1 Tax=Solicola gregarius TaxID=2908642 RepID=A0AA46YL85_9ACTN|nr:putative lipid II flippase FtsW [Solicola gregarius]UYM05354.1 putative lipid II flippase FtsW [Solicola gregarius]